MQEGGSGGSSGAQAPGGSRRREDAGKTVLFFLNILFVCSLKGILNGLLVSVVGFMFFLTKEV